jgi:hypothetical protein
MGAETVMSGEFRPGFFGAVEQPVASLAIATSPSSTGDIETNLAVQPVLEARDAEGNLVTGHASPITFTAYSDSTCTTPVSSALGAGAAVTAVGGVATFSTLRVIRTQVVALRASTGSVTSNCISGLTISPGVPDLVVPIEVLHHPIASALTATTWTSAAVIVDPNDFDGTPVYSFEIVARNTHALNDYSVDLMNGAAVVSSVVVPASTTVPTRIRQVFTATAAAATLRIATPATAAASDLILYTARILVKQTNATKTRIYFPMIGGSATIAPTTLNTYTLWGETNQVMTGSGYGRIFRKTTGAWATIPAGNSWRSEISVVSSAVSRPCLTQIYNRSTGLPVTGSNTSSTSITLIHTSVSFSNAAVNFDDGDLFEIRIRTSNGSVHSCRIANANLSVRLTGLTKAEIPHRLSYYQSLVGAASTQQNLSRHSIVPSDYSYSKFFYESDGVSTVADNANVVELSRNTVEDASAGTAVSGSSTVVPSNIAPSTRTLQRSSELSSSGFDYLTTKLTNNSGTMTHSGSALLIQIGNQ